MVSPHTILKNRLGCLVPRLLFAGSWEERDGFHEIHIIDPTMTSSTNNSSLLHRSISSKVAFLALLLSFAFVPNEQAFCLAAKTLVEKNDRFDNTDDIRKWSQCNCQSTTDADTADKKKNAAKMAYLITVHNRRTLHDGAYLLKALMETSHPGNIAVILIHVDHRVGIASSSSAANGKEVGTNNYKKNNETNKHQFLYDASPLKRYVDACLQNSCARSSTASSNNNVPLLQVHSHFAPEWGKWSMNEPTLWAMEYLLYHTELHRHRRTVSSSWDVFINLSGDTLPVISAQRISQLFNPIDGPLSNTNFVTSSSCATGLIPTSIYDFPKGTMKRAHYFQHGIPKTLSYVDTTTGLWKRDVETPIYFGSQWMALTFEFVEFVIRSMSHPNGLGNVLRETLVTTDVLMTDETFFATMLMNSPFNDTIPKLTPTESKEEDGNKNKRALITYPSMHSLRYERMDENTPNAWGKYTSSNSLYDIPPKFKSVTDGEGPSRPWGPYFLGMYDMGGIKDSGALFIRKVSWSVDENLVRLLPVILKGGGGEEDGEKEEEKGELLEWDVLPNIRWPRNGVKIKEPWVWKSENNTKEEDEEEDEEEEEEQ
jgi:hypothetical protein